MIIFRVLPIVFLEVIYVQGAAWPDFLALDAHQYPQLSLLTINGWRGLIIIFSSDTLWLNRYFTISISTPHPTKPINSTTLRHLCSHLDFFISILSFVCFSKSSNCTRKKVSTPDCRTKQILCIPNCRTKLINKIQLINL